MRPPVRPFLAAVVVVALGAASLVAPPEPLSAQVKIGEYGLFQPGTTGPVGWVVSNGDRSREWWAYVDGVYTWADVAHGPGNRWKLEAERVGDASWQSYAAWKAAVLARPAAQGRRIVFQDHSVAEESVQN